LAAPKGFRRKSAAIDERSARYRGNDGRFVELWVCPGAGRMACSADKVFWKISAAALQRQPN
jgi:hypothetical protein